MQDVGALLEEVVEQVDVCVVVEQQVHELEVVVERHEEQREAVSIAPVQLVRVQLQQILEAPAKRNHVVQFLKLNDCDV